MKKGLVVLFAWVLVVLMGISANTANDLPRDVGLGDISCAYKWYPGIVHVHSTYSDGDRTPAMLKNAAAAIKCSFLIVTDHFEQIPNDKKLSGLVTDDFGFDKYIKDFLVEDPLICIPGFEISSKEGSHILTILDSKRISKLDLTDTQENLLKKLTTKMDQKGLPIAAHPGVGQGFLKDQTEGLKGIEFYNENAKDYKETLKWYLSLIAKGNYPNGQYPFVTAGCDSHSSVEPTDLSRWQRLTVVWIDGDLTRANILTAFYKGQTYAANYGAYIKASNYLPGDIYTEVDVPEFHLEINFALPTKSKKTIRIYRQGELVPDSVVTFEKNITGFTYDWQDGQVKGNSDKTYAYVIEVENCLITSPIFLYIR
jgi:hypothetical protein